MVWDVFHMVAQNSGTTFEVAVCIIALCGGIIWYAKGFQIGNLINFFIFGSIFIWFYNTSLEWAIPLILFLLFFVLMALSLYPINQVQQQGGIA